MTREPPHGNQTPCFWCAARTRMRITFDIRVDYGPCETCKTEMARGIAVIECRESEPFERHIRPGISPTGRWAVIKPDGLERFLSAAIYEDVMRERQSLLPEPLFAKLASGERAAN
jgi:hypothetical protein